MKVQAVPSMQTVQAIQATALTSDHVADGINRSRLIITFQSHPLAIGVVSHQKSVIKIW